VVYGVVGVMCELPREKAPYVRSHSSDVFNSIIHILCLRETFMHGGKYIWTNKHVSPALENLDSILMSSN
jgi:hypothetical protein